MSFSSIRSYLSKGNRATWCIFVLFALMLFVKCVLFHWSTFHSILVSTLWKNPIDFYKFYMAKLLMPLFIASFIFISKRRWWTCLVSFLVDIWLISNTIYYKTYDSFLSVNDILLANNMGGAWSSVIAYFDWIMVIYLCISVIWCIIITKFPQNVNLLKLEFVISFVLIFWLTFLNNYLIKNSRFWPGNESNNIEQELEWIKWVNEHGGSERLPNDPQGYIPFYDVYFDAAKNVTCTSAKFMRPYIRQQSIISDFFAIVVYHFFSKELNEEIIQLKDNDILKVSNFINTNSYHHTPQGKLLIILVESLESWPIDENVEGICVAPYLRQLSKQNHILYCNHIKNQALGGNSGDGQMTINTGLLPTINYVACMSYGNNRYPNIAGLYHSTTIINPWPEIWNQDTMSVRYGYKQKLEPNGSQWQDAEILDSTIHVMSTQQQSQCILTITVSTHSPFNRVHNDRVITSAPAVLNRYLQVLNYTDSCMQQFLESVFEDSEFSRYTIVITGDHTIFKTAMLEEFQDFTTEQNLSIASGDNFCPLIIYSPSIEGNIQVTDTCYQMDIYPTIMHLIGCEDYYWKGFGVNLLDSVARHNRPISEQEAYRLSDLMIRSNYFQNYAK